MANSMGKRTLLAFISSRTTELHDERIVLKEALSKRGINSFVFELDAGARPEPPRQAFLDEVGKADVYIGIFWNEFSQAVVDEFEQARTLFKPCLLYIKSYSVKRDARLEAFIARISNSTDAITVRNFSDVMQLAQFAGRDIQEWLVADWHSKSESDRLPAPSQRRLEVDASQVMALIKRSPTISILHRSPRRYLVQFQLRGIQRLDEFGVPVFVDSHVVEISLHKDYPMTLPFMRFQTPVFHPNIYESGSVCMGWFKLPYWLSDVFVRLGRMIDFQVFDTTCPANGDAAAWAVENRHLFPLASWQPYARESTNVKTDRQDA